MLGKKCKNIAILTKAIKEDWKPNIKEEQLVEAIINNIETNSDYEIGNSYNLAICGNYGLGKSYFIESLEEFLTKEDLRGDFKLKKEAEIYQNTDLTIKIWRN